MDDWTGEQPGFRAATGESARRLIRTARASAGAEGFFPIVACLPRGEQVVFDRSLFADPPLFLL